MALRARFVGGRPSQFSALVGDLVRTEPTVVDLVGFEREEDEAVGSSAIGREDEEETGEKKGTDRKRFP
jgi:hypothetical protein